MVNLSDASSYNVAVTILLVTLGIGTIAISIAVFMYLDAAIKLKRHQQIGKRLEQECGKEVTEIETERYYIYKAFEENKLHKKITDIVVLLRTMMGLIIISILVVYGFWMYLLFNTKAKNGPDDFEKFIIQRLGKEYDARKQRTQLLGWIIYGVLAALLVTGASGSWSRAADSKKYRVNVLSADAEKGAAELTKDLKNAMSKVPGISSPWFPIVLIVVYGFVWASLTWKMEDGPRVESKGGGWWLFVIVLYFFTAFMVWFIEKDTRSLFANVLGSYHAKKTQLQTYIQNLFQAGNPAPKKTLEARKYFKNWIETTTKGVEVQASDLNGATGSYAGQLWKYIQHRSGKEMEELHKLDKDNVDAIRKWALRLRMTSAPMRKAANQFTRSAIVFSMILLVTIFFALFNFISRQWSSTNMAIASLLFIFIFTVVTTWFGWFSSAISL